MESKDRFDRIVDALEGIWSELGRLADVNTRLADMMSEPMEAQADLAKTEPVSAEGQPEPEHPGVVKESTAIADTAAEAIDDKPSVEETWNPYNEDIQGRYNKEKQDILDKELASLGVNVPAKATGADKHRALLEHANSPEAVEPTPAPQAEAPAPQAEEDPFGLPKAEPGAAVTREDVTEAGKKLMAKPGWDPAKIKALMSEVTGTESFADVSDDKLPALHEAIIKELAA